MLNTQRSDRKSACDWKIGTNAVYPYPERIEIVGARVGGGGSKRVLTVHTASENSLLKQGDDF